MKKPQPFLAEGLETVLPMNLIATGSVPGGSALTGIVKKISRKIHRGKLYITSEEGVTEADQIRQLKIKNKRIVSGNLIHSIEAH